MKVITIKHYPPGAYVWFAHQRREDGTYDSTFRLAAGVVDRVTVSIRGGGESIIYHLRDCRGHRFEVWDTMIFKSAKEARQTVKKRMEKSK